MSSPRGLDAPYIAEVTIDRSSAIPLYSQIAAPLEHLITSGELPPGQLIEDEVSMAHRLAVSRPTARRALQDLVSRGLLTRRRGAGTHVTPTHVRRPLSLTSLNDDLVKAGFTPRTEVLSYSISLADAADAQRLGCPESQEIVRIVRRRLVDDQPLALMTNILGADIAPTLTRLSEKGLYSCLADLGIKPVSAQQSIGARALADDEAPLLGMSAGDPALTMERTAFDANGRTVEYGSHVYNADLYSFRFTLNDSGTA
ncbi:GntR family transcriptional regulator [Actinomyces sp. B33]|uniref:GntR family transcriptional regulator n=1 Tax=Actinomyces sp. B33 TaxID=2942131 RepID=UPI0023406D9D|nr:GntR family transcriptional regulator [Actinomyces sp. B33]MDC4232491.1 GntR family transcriptional regulator [Actinomyces sp. B33]